MSAQSRAPVESHWPAPAKLNLFLHITGKRSDGFHDLQTLFQLIDLCDDIAIMRVRLARPEEKAKYREEAATRSHETGLVAVYLVKLDRAQAIDADAVLFE